MNHTAGDGKTYVDDLSKEELRAEVRRLLGAAPGDGPTDSATLRRMADKREAVGGWSGEPALLRRAADSIAAQASPAVREAAMRVLVQMPTRPEPDPDTGEYPLVYLSVTAPIWDALDVLRAALDAESVEEHMSGIYKGPGGQLLHGDGKPVGEPPRPAKRAAPASPAVREAAELRLALRWALSKIGQPTRRVAGPLGNAEHFDAYQRAAALAAEGERP